MNAHGLRAVPAVILALIAAAALPAAPAAAAGTLSLKQVVKAVQPTVVTSAPGRPDLLYIAQRRGRIRIVRNGRLIRGSFLDLSGRVNSTWLEQGLLGLTFAPDYAKTRRFYVDYTGRDGSVVIAEYRQRPDDPFRADPASRRPLLVIPPVADKHGHNGGMLRFHDGDLFISVGDGNDPGDAAGNAQNPESLRGKILRIDPRPDLAAGRTYRIPADNPLVGLPGRDEIFARGLRNPHSFSFYQPAGGSPHMLIADVGQARYEEINYLPVTRAAGGNFGWKFYEAGASYDCGLLCPNGAPVPPPPAGPAPGSLLWPALTYTHEQGCAVIGGPVVSDPGLPSLRGRMIYGDFCSSTLRSATPATPLMTGDRPLGIYLPPGQGKHPALDGIGTGSNGEIYLFSNFGPVYRLFETPAVPAKER